MTEWDQDAPRSPGFAARSLTTTDDEDKADPIQDIKDTFKLMINIRMVMLMPMIIWSAFSIAIFGSVFINLMTRTMKNQPDFYGTDLTSDVTLQNSFALYTMSLLGLGEIFGG